MSLPLKSFIVFQGNLIAKFLGLIGMSLVAHLMGPGPIGMLAFAYAFIGLFEFIFDPGLSTAHIKLAAEKKDFDYCVGTYLFLKIVSTIIASVVILGAVFWTIRFRGGFESPDLKVVVYIILFSKVIENIFMYPLVSFNATQEMAKRTAIQIVKSIAELIFVSSVALFFRNVLALALTHVLTEIVIAGTSLYLFKDYQIKCPRLLDLKRYIKFSLPLIGAAVIGILSRNIDKVMIQAFWGSIEVGQYHCAGRATMVILIFSSSLMTVLIPTFSLLHTRGGPGELNELLAKSEKYLILLTGPALVVLFVFARPLVILILGNKFEMSILITRILCVSTLCITVIRPLNSLIIGTGRVKWIFYWTFFAVGVNLIFNSILIPEQFLGIKMLGLGAPGAAIATVISVVLAVIATIIYLMKTEKIKLFVNLGKYLFPVFIIVPLFIFGIFPITGEDIWVLSLSPLAIIFYLGLLALSGEFGKPEIQLLIMTINPQRLKEYISGEFQDEKKS